MKSKQSWILSFSTFDPEPNSNPTYYLQQTKPPCITFTNYAAVANTWEGAGHMGKANFTAAQELSGHCIHPPHPWCNVLCLLCSKPYNKTGVSRWRYAYRFLGLHLVGLNYKYLELSMYLHDSLRLILRVCCNGAIRLTCLEHNS